MDMAASIQVVIEEIILKLTKSIAEEYKVKNLCLAGGVALNCVANGKILVKNHFDNIWIQPAAGDAGGSLGAALGYWFQELGNQRSVEPGDSMKGSYLGPKFDNGEIENSLKKLDAHYQKYNDDEVTKIIAESIADQKTIGWFQGRMEFGPRALGARSILADPRSEEMQKELNLKIKFRESFRPFAPSILSDQVGKWFETDKKSPYMLLVSNVKKSLRIPMTREQRRSFWN